MEKTIGNWFSGEVLVNAIHTMKKEIFELQKQVKELKEIIDKTEGDGK